MSGVIIVGVLGYCGFIAVKKIKDIKKGKYCSCSCSNCHMKCKKS